MMISSTQYSPNILHPSRVSPVMESEGELDDYDDYDDDEDYSPSDNNANGEAYMVTDFYHQPVLPVPAAVSSRGSDSAPEYCTPWANSPGSMRHVFSPAFSIGSSGKQKPRMGIMATRSLSEKSGGKSSDSRTFYPDLTPSQVSNEDLDSPVYDSTQYIVTPTRRRNSEHDKSPNGRNTLRRDGGSGGGGGMEYPEVRGRLGEGEELSSAVPPGVVLLQPNMFNKDGTLDPRILSEIEMSSLRVAMPPPSPDTETSGDSSTVQDHLLTNHHHHHHMNNGKSLMSSHIYPQHQHPNSSNKPYALGNPRPRPVTGSGVVFRRRRKPCWCVLTVLVALALIATGVTLGVLFGVVKQEEAGGAGSSLGGGLRDNATLTSSTNSAIEEEELHHHHKADVTESTSSVPEHPPTTTPPIPPREPSGVGWGVSVRRFKAYWHPGDSRVLEVLLSNGTVLQAAGHKANDGTFRGLYSLSLTDGMGRTTRVRFMGGRSLASVSLPQGTVVNLDWSANNADIECKVFQIPPPRGAAPSGGHGAAGVPPLNHRHSASSHLAMLQLGVHSYLLRQISRTLDEASATPGAWEEEPLSASSPKFCAPRLPIKVTKCGGHYPYDGAFVQGEVTLQTGPPLMMVALPWLRQDDQDECYSDLQSQDASPNFFIPLPGHVDRASALDMAGRFWRTAARWWGRVCDVVGTVLEVDLERHKVCANMAASAQTQLASGEIYSIVYDSCAALLNSLHLTCRTLDDLTTRAAINAANRGGGGGGSGSGSSSGSSSGSGGNSASGGPRSGSRQPLTQELLQRVLANATSLQEPATAPEHNVVVKTYAFCPSTQPLVSYEKSITLQTSAGGVMSQDITAADMVHVNCPGHPEVTYFYLGHAAAIEPLDKVKHRLKVCAVCAFEKTFSVHVRRDHMCCNDTCARESRCEQSISSSSSSGSADSRGDGLGLRESHTFRRQSNVYCHEFLTAADTPATRALPRKCLGTCQSNLEVRFQVKDADDDERGGGGGGRVYLDQVLTCLEGYLSTCKSTFGH
ncbi:hypothetical protein ACOMHN_050427 [Nucella lapillus]